MKETRSVRVGFALWLGLLTGGLLGLAVQGDIVISEFMADDFRSLTDEDGEHPDWIELHNSGTGTVNLEGWFLTDEEADLNKWRLPETNLVAGGYLTVFASGKDRRVPGRPLHTSFKLDPKGEYLAVVKPDGSSIAFAYASEYPPQASGMSYGVPMRRTAATLVDRSTTVQALVPPDSSVDGSWTGPDYVADDWLVAANGTGFDGGGEPVVFSVVVADSQADFSGTQGGLGWYYGYWDKSADTNSTYQVGDFTHFPSDPGPYGPGNYWNGASWDWHGGDPPWVEIGERYTHPSGKNSGAEIWAIRRWLCTVAGTVTVEWSGAKQNPFGSGVSVRLFHHGAEKATLTVAGGNLDGVSRTNVLAGVAIGDAIDIAVLPINGGATDDIGDGTYVRVVIRAGRSLQDVIATDLGDQMRGVRGTAYLRYPFTVTDPSAVEFLDLRLMYDDGFIAWLNGVEVARANAPTEPAWDSCATGKRELEQALEFETFDLSSFHDLLMAGDNVLAVQGMNASVDDPTFLIAAELRAEKVDLTLGAPCYFSLPTPGGPNGPGNDHLGPLILEVAHSPVQPGEHEDLTVTARLAQTFRPVSEVTLTYRVMFGADLTIAMWDDGNHGDGAAGDGVWGAVIPAEAYGPGQMVRYFINASDTETGVSRSPPYPDPKNSPQYHGTVVIDPTIVTALPVLHWFLRTPSAADTPLGARGSIFYQGEFKDNIRAFIHGQSSQAFPKKSYNFDMNSGDHFQFDPLERRVKKFNLLTTYPDKAHMRNILSYEMFRDAGSPYHAAFALRVQRNGAFYCDAHYVEDGDEEYLARLGLDPKGALYKAYNALETATSGMEKKTRRFESNADVRALVSGLRLSGTARTRYIFDNIDIPAMVNYLAALIVTGNVDCCHKNYYLYRDSEGTGEWQFTPWDVDLSFGRNWTSASTYYDDTMYWQNGLWVGSNNTLPAALFATPAIRQMYLRRLRTLIETLLQPPGTPPAELKLEKRIDELATSIGPDAALDFAKWPTWGKPQTLPQAVAIMTNEYMPKRRTFLFTTQGVDRGGPIPSAQPDNTTVTIEEVEANPASANQDEEYIRLFNRNNYAVDVSGWRLTGAVSHTFRPGTVVPTNHSLYVSPNVVAFRGRSASPKGGQSLLVQGNYQGRLSAWGETLNLVDTKLRAAHTFTYAGNPSLAQRYLRITQIMYHPAPLPSGSPFSPEDGEYLELKNIGSVALDLNGVRFTEGIRFGFTGTAVTNLDPGSRLFVVKNRAAFLALYGSATIAGEFEGALENQGEQLRLDDAQGEKVLEFSYDNTWYPITDGQGVALVIADENLSWSDWGRAGSWRPSIQVYESPLEWRQRCFSQDELNDPLISGDEADPDGDGVCNRQEYLAGTNPREAESRLRLSVAVGPDGARARFEAAPGRSYGLQSASSLDDGVWQFLMSVPAQDSAQVVELPLPAPAPSQAKFFRVVMPAGP